MIRVRSKPSRRNSGVHLENPFDLLGLLDDDPTLDLGLAVRTDPRLGLDVLRALRAAGPYVLPRQRNRNGDNPHDKAEQVVRPDGDAECRT